MRNVLIAGMGHVGVTVALFLAESKDYHVVLADKEVGNGDFFTSIRDRYSLDFYQIDFMDLSAVKKGIQTLSLSTVVSCLPFYCNKVLAQVVSDLGLNYFDLTEDVETTHYIRQLSEKSSNVFMPQCGLAPGLVNIIAHDLAGKFDTPESLVIYTGAIPRSVSHSLKYSLTWSVDGLINEYINPCAAIKEGEIVEVSPLEGLETIHLNGVRYEAFTTSGGIAHLTECYQGKLKELWYKTIRYPGHCEKMRFLLNDLKLKENRDVLRAILVSSLPKTVDDVILVYIVVLGYIQGERNEKTFFRRYERKKIHGFECTAIQYTTAAGICTMMDCVLNHGWKGFVSAEKITAKMFFENPFSHVLKQED
jgi:saccharopine dehydrogenase-like NADP-dependent oxidoreductase